MQQRQTPQSPSEDGRCPSARLTLRTVQHGAESLSWPLRSVRVDPDVYVVTDGLQPPPFALEAETRPLVVELTAPAGGSPVCADFLPTLRSTDGRVGRRLDEIARQGAGSRGIRPPQDSAALLWSELIGEERRLRARAGRIDCAKQSTREALFRRLLVSADFIQSNYAEPLRVEALAEVSNLSPFHFARLFSLVMNETPHAFLVRKRLSVARRLLAAGTPRGEVAVRSGFGCRTTLFRHLRRAAAAPT